MLSHTRIYVPTNFVITISSLCTVYIFQNIKKILYF